MNKLLKILTLTALISTATYAQKQNIPTIHKEKTETETKIEQYYQTNKYVKELALVKRFPKKDSIIDTSKTMLNGNPHTTINLLAKYDTIIMSRKKNIDEPFLTKRDLKLLFYYNNFPKMYKSFNNKKPLKSIKFHIAKQSKEKINSYYLSYNKFVQNNFENHDINCEHYREFYNQIKYKIERIPQNNFDKINEVAKELFIMKDMNK